MAAAPEAGGLLLPAGCTGLVSLLLHTITRVPALEAALESKCDTRTVQAALLELLAEQQENEQPRERPALREETRTSRREELERHIKDAEERSKRLGTGITGFDVFPFGLLGQ